MVLSALEGVDGVVSVALDYENKHATIGANGAVCTDDGAKALTDALEEKRYGGSIRAISHTGG